MRPKRTIEPEKPKIDQRRAPSRITQKNEFKKFYSSHDSVCSYCIALLTDGYNRFSFTKSADSLSRDISTIHCRYKAEGLSFFALTLPKLFQFLLNYLETGISSYPGFRLKKGSEYPAFMQRLFEMIYDSETCEADKANAISVLYQVCTPFKKLKGPYRNSVLRKQLADFVQTDIDLKNQDFMSDPETRVIIATARNFISSIIEGLDPEISDQDFLPRPGPGATNTKTEKHVRFRPHVLYTQLDQEFPYEEWFYSHPWDLVTGTHKHPFRLPKEDAPTSRFKFVPKTFGKPRGICIEQLETQYLQQAIKNKLYDVIETNPLTRGKVNFINQNVNRDLALRGSLDGSLATLDMSEASDRISRRLVSALFKGNPLFLRKLDALSTRIIQLPDIINFIPDFPSEKFAPMGSALCFPVMALTHYALLRAILIHSDQSKLIPSIHVYGDDIIIAKQCVEVVYKYLPRFGMKFNVEKSFYKSKFRESCGLHAFAGREITPVYFKYTPTPNMNATEMVSCLQTEGQLYKKGYKETSKLLRTELLRHCKKLGLKDQYVRPQQQILGFIRENAVPSSFSNISIVKKVWCPELQAFKGKVLLVIPEMDRLPPIPMDEGLLRWFLTLANLEIDTKNRNQTHVSGSYIRSRTVYKWLLESELNPLTLVGLTT